MTEIAEPLTILDPHLVEELQPPCDLSDLQKSIHGGGEAKPAEWIYVEICDTCGPHQLLLCDECKNLACVISTDNGGRVAHGGRAHCRGYGLARIVSIDKL